MSLSDAAHFNSPASTLAPLEGIRVLDFSRMVAGPFCSMLLGSMGAEVIKIERPGCGDDFRHWGPPFIEGESGCFLSVNQNKKSVSLNLQMQVGRELCRELAARSDIVIENFSAGTMDRWGLGYSDLSKLNPSIIYCAITGYGQTGSFRNRPGYDFVIQAESGIMSVTGAEGGEAYRVGIPLTDIAAALFATVAIQAALRVRDRCNIGQMVDVSLLDSAVALLANVATNYLITGEPAGRFGNAQPNVVPYEVFATSDGHLALAVGNDSQFSRLCKALNRCDLAEDTRFSTNPSRVLNRHSLIPELAQAFIRRSTDDWLRKLEEIDVPSGPINSVADILMQPIVEQRGMVVEFQHLAAGLLRLLGLPPMLSVTPLRARLPPPVLGQHTEEVLVKILDYAPTRIAQLRSEGVI